MGTLCLRPMQGLALCVCAVSVGNCCTFRQCSMGSAPNSTRQTATATRHEVNPPTFSWNTPPVKNNTPTPPEPKPLDSPRALAPSCGTANQANPSLNLPLFGTANQAPTLPLFLELPSSPYLSCNQDPWSTPPSTRPVLVGTSSFPQPPGQLRCVPPPPHRLRNLLRPWGPCPYHLPPQNRSLWPCPPSPDPPCGTAIASGTNPRYPFPPHRASFSFFVRVRNNLLPGVRALTTHGTEAFGPAPRALTFFVVLPLFLQPTPYPTLP